MKQIQPYTPYGKSVIFRRDEDGGYVYTPIPADAFVANHAPKRKKKESYINFRKRTYNHNKALRLRLRFGESRAILLYKMRVGVVSPYYFLRQSE